MPLTKITSGEFQDSSVSFSGIVTAGSLSVPAGPILIGSATSTGTAAQRLQVTGGGYFSGRIGIGTTNPNIIGANDNCPVLSLYSNGANVNARSVLELANPFTSTNGSVLGDIYFTSARTSVTGFTTEWSLIRSSLTGSLSSFGYGTAISFHTKSNNGAASFRESARFDSEANFLVGASTPTGTASQPLQVTGGAYVSGNLGIGFTNPTNKLQVFGNTIVSGAVGVATTNATQPFQVGSGTTIVVVDNMGELGIGTTNPTSKLQVVGDANVSGVVTSFDFYNTAEYPSVRPTLDLAFAQTKILDSRITFTRSSTATYFNASGIVTTAATNEPRFDHNPATGESLGLLIEESRTNLCERSQEFDNAYFDTTTGTRVIPNSAIAPDGTFTADLLQEDTSTGIHSRFRYGIYTMQSGLYFTSSAFVKPAGRTTVTLEYRDDIHTVFNLQTLTVSGGGSGNATLVASSITPLPNGWYRITATSLGSGPYNSGFGIGLYGGGNRSYTGDGVSGVYVWGLQVEQGAFPTSYIPTLSTFTSRASNATYYTSTGLVGTATTDQARSNTFFPDSNGVMRPAGLLLEPVGVNTALYSEQFDNAAWGKASATVTANSVVAPDGNTTADTFSSTGTSSYVYQTFTASAQTYTISVFAKAGTATSFRLDFVTVGFGLGGSCTFDLSAGTAGSVTLYGGSTGFTPSIQKLGNGWYRCSLTGTATATTWYNELALINNSGNNIYIWGAQLESSSYPTSYIQTTAGISTRAADVSSSATVTRSADVASITGSNFSSWYRQDEGTWFGSITKFSGAARLIEATGPSGAYSMSIRPNASSSNVGFARFDSSSVTVTYTSLPVNISASYNSPSIQGAVNGRLSSLLANGINSNSINNLDIGRISSENAYIGGTISRLTYYSVRLSNNILQTITL